MKKVLFLRIFKYAGWHKKLLFHATDEQERSDILFYFGKRAKVLVAKDTPGTPPGDWKPCIKEKGHLRCVFISRIHPKKNLDYILSRLLEISTLGTISLDVYGMEDDPRYAAQCRQMAASLKDGVQVHFKGPLVYSEVATTLQKHHLFVLPTLGENFGHAIFESLSEGRPALISDQTPWRGLEVKKAGWDIPLDQPARYLDALKKAMGFDQQEFNEWCHASWEFAKDYANQTDLKSEYMELFA